MSQFCSIPSFHLLQIMPCLTVRSSSEEAEGGSARRISRILFTPCGAPIIHLSDQPGISPASRRTPNQAGHPFNPLFDLAPRRVCLARVVSDAPVVSCTTLSPLPLTGGLFSVALSIARDRPAPPVLDRRVLRPVESGLSSSLRTRSVTRTEPPKIKDRDRAYARSLCRPPAPSCAPPSVPWTAAPPDGSPHRRSRRSAEQPPASASCADAHSRAAYVD